MMQNNSLKEVCHLSFIQVCMVSLVCLIVLSENVLLNRGLNADDVTEKTQQATTEVKPISASGSETKKTYQLVYKFHPSQIIRYSIKNTTSVDTVKGDFSEVNTNESLTEMHYRVVSVNSENQAVLEPVLDHVKMSAIFADAEPVHYDSAKNEELPVQFTGVDKSIGKPLSRYTYNRQGKLLKITDLRDAGKGDPNITNTTVNSIELLGNKNFLIFFPDHPVKIGEKWNEKYETNLKVGDSLNQRVQLIRKYQLESVVNNQADIKLNTVLISQIDDPKLRLQLIQKAPTGKLVFDIEKGVVVSRELVVEKTEFGIFGQSSKISVSVVRTEKQIQ